MRNRDEVVKRQQRHLFNVLDIGFHADGAFALQTLRRHNLGAMHGHPFLTRLPRHLGHPIRIVVCLGSRAGHLMHSPILLLAAFAAVLDIVTRTRFQCQLLVTSEAGDRGTGRVAAAARVRPVPR